jgi:hypothetical protein
MLLRKIAGEGIVLLKMKLCFSQLMQAKKIIAEMSI